MVKAIAVKDRKNPTDRWGNPRYILMLVEPPELRGLIAFPIDEVIITPNNEYEVEIIKKCERCAKVKIIRSEKYGIPVRKGAWKYIQEWRYKLDTMPPPSPPTIKKLYVALWDKTAYEDYFITKKRGNPCELHCTQSLTSVVLDDAWPGTKTTCCYRGDWLERWRCTSSAQSDIIDFVWYVDGVGIYASEQEALEAYNLLMNRYKEDLAKYEEEVKKLQAKLQAIEDIKSDRIIIGDFGVRNTSIYNLLL